MAGHAGEPVPVATPGHDCPTCGQRVPLPSAGRPRGGKVARVALLHAEGLSDETIATSLGISVSTVAQYRRRALRRARR